MNERTPAATSPPIRRIAREHRVRGATARRWFEECLRFLDLCARSAVPLSPPVKVDRAWHEFVLHTRDCAAFCDERHGRLIHHDPSERDDGGAGYRRAYGLGVAAHGTVDAKIWPAPKGERATGRCTGGSGGGCASDGGSGCGGGGFGGG